MVLGFTSIVKVWLTIPRNNYAAAKLQGLEKELSLSDAQYQTALSILFVGYVTTMSSAYRA